MGTKVAPWARLVKFFKNNTAFYEGMRDGIPISLGYLAVGFSLGIVARNAGLSASQGFLTSILVNASAGQFAGFSLIAAHASYLEVALITLVANARYLLMSCALSQRFAPSTSLVHRFLLGFSVTDELFGITIARPGTFNPYYTYGAFLVASPGWATGTALGIVAGNMLPSQLVSALSVGLFGMFLAVIIPPSKQNKVVGIFVAVSFAASYAATRLPVISEWSDGTRTIVLTVLISAVAAVLFPVNKKKEVREHDA